MLIFTLNRCFEELSSSADQRAKKNKAEKYIRHHIGSHSHHHQEEKEEKEDERRKRMSTTVGELVES